MPDGAVLGHSLLPIRGRTPRHQPAEGRRGVLAFTGELWDVAVIRLAAQVQILAGIDMDPGGAGADLAKAVKIIAEARISASV